MGHNNRMTPHAGKGIDIGHGVIYVVYGVCLPTGYRLYMAADTVCDLYLIEYRAIKGHV